MADTVIDPGAVVVHLENAVATFLAVVSSYRLPSFLSWALLTEFQRYPVGKERRVHSLRDASRTSPRCPLMRDYHQGDKPVERDKIPETPAGQRNSLYELLLDVRLVVPVRYAETISAVNSIQDQK